MSLFLVCASLYEHSLNCLLSLLLRVVSQRPLLHTSEGVAHRCRGAKKEKRCKTQQACEAFDLTDQMLFNGSGCSISTERVGNFKFEVHAGRCFGREYRGGDGRGCGGRLRQLGRPRARRQPDAGARVPRGRALRAVPRSRRHGRHVGAPVDWEGFTKYVLKVHILFNSVTFPQ